MISFIDKWRRCRHLNCSEFIEQLSEPLAEEVAIEYHQAFILGTTVFTEAEQGFLMYIARHLTVLFALERDIIVRENERGKEMYFVIDGECEALCKLEGIQSIIPIRQGSYFGEIALLKKVLL